MLLGWRLSTTNINNTIRIDGKTYELKQWITYRDDNPPPTPTPIPTPTPTPSKDVDQFGVKMLYNSKPNGESWFLDVNKLCANADPQVKYSNSLKTTDLKNLGDGSVKVTKTVDAENRFNILTSTGYDHNKCILDWKQLIARGYMQAPNDWRNVEITSYCRINKVFVSSGHSLVHYARGGHHSPSYPCEGSSYKGNIQYSGDSRFQREVGHPNYAYSKSKATPLSGGQLFGRWFGYKFCLYDLKDGTVKLENWLDLAQDNNWIKIDEYVDKGAWIPTRVSPCVDSSHQDQLIIWGGPQACFRFDSAKDIDFKKLSVREIQVV